MGATGTQRFDIRLYSNPYLETIIG